MSEALQSDYRTTIEAFHAFIEDRPDDEKWELIDGEIVLNPTPTIVISTSSESPVRTRTHSPADEALWQAFPGIGTRHPEDQHNEIDSRRDDRPADVGESPTGPTMSSWSSRSCRPFSFRRDMVRKRAFYTRIDSLTHYIVLAQDRREATVFARNADFVPRPISADGIIAIEPLGLSLPLAEVYRDILFRSRFWKRSCVKQGLRRPHHRGNAEWSTGRGLPQRRKSKNPSQNLGRTSRSSDK